MIKIWNTNDGTMIKTLVGHKGPVNSIAILYGGDIASGSSDYTIRIWDPIDGSLLKLINAEYEVDILGVLSNGYLYNTLKNSERVFLWNPSDGRQVGELYANIRNKMAKALPNNLLALTSDYNFQIELLSIQYDNGMLVYNRLGSLIGHTKPVSSIAVLLNGDIISGSEDSKIIQWRNNTPEKSYNGHFSKITSMTVLKNGDLLSSSLDSAKLWKINSSLLF
jgi:WD40 repeat protein